MNSAILPSLFFSSAALRRKKQTRNTAPVAVSLGPAGIKPTEAKKSSISQGFSPDGLRRSAFNSTPDRWGLCRSAFEPSRFV